ncbi:mevalonyl-coenzyme A hydratase sidH-like [Sceloporus undulatus]|uniref:mevalonyl-coenzyme A hydratase sidH-like n=1 Tax=Sceloporus undulatus TaxID=8520 RepID=UPI001C4BCFDF|nr:mevalonyl-coenzyme A hydratase sidH-like [Sceloporus undulatus]
MGLNSQMLKCLLFKLLLEIIYEDLSASNLSDDISALNKPLGNLGQSTLQPSEEGKETQPPFEKTCPSVLIFFSPSMSRFAAGSVRKRSSPPSPALEATLSSHPSHADRSASSGAESHPRLVGREEDLLCRLDTNGGRRNVITEIHGTIMTIGINRPEARNAVNQETAELLVQAFQSFEEDSSLNVAVLHGLGGNFCAGYDLKELAHNPSSIKLEQDVTKDPALMGPSRMTFSKPVIAAVSGYAVAGGLELSLLADLRVVEESAIFGVFCRRFGVPLIDGGTVRLPKLIGLSRAMDLILTGRPVSAQEAYQFGLANRIVPSGQALQHAIELAEQISAFPQQCMRADRNSAYYNEFDASSFTEAMQHEFDTGAKVILKESVPGAKKFSLGQGRSGAKL